MVKNIALLLRMMKIFDNYMMIRATKILNYILSIELYDIKLYFSTAAFKHLVLTIVWKPPPPPISIHSTCSQSDCLSTVLGRKVHIDKTAKFEGSESCSVPSSMMTPEP